MLLRSASTPLLNSFTPVTAKDSSPEPELLPQLHRTRSVTLTATSPGSISPVDHNYSAKRMTPARSESNLRDLGLPKKKPPLATVLDGLAVEEVRDLEGAALQEAVEGLKIGSFGGKFLGSGLETLIDIGGGCGDGGSICGGGGGGGSDGRDGGDEGFGDEWGKGKGNGSTDAYYKRMIEADPGNPLLLSNYAKYLKELGGDLAKAEEYCGRSILMNPNDGDTLSMYGDLIWQQHKDAERAETYFDQAVKASPDDCYVMASYARFLWDAVEDDDEEAAEEPFMTSPPSFFHGIPPSVPTIAAAS